MIYDLGYADRVKVVRQYTEARGIHLAEGRALAELSPAPFAPRRARCAMRSSAGW